MTDILRPIIHYSFHFLMPGVFARFWDKDKWKKIWLILVLTNLVDLDHLFADPIFDPDRMSVGFHPLHSYPAIGLYCIFLFPKKTRLIAIGLLFHMLTDALDYYLKGLI